MKRIVLRHFASKIESFCHLLGAETTAPMKQFHLSIGSTNSSRSGKTRRVDVRRKHLSAALSSKAEKKPTLRETKTRLRSIPGVGPKNEQLLCSKGIVSIESLRSVFQDKFSKEQTPFIEFLLKEVGILHKNHCQSIAGYLTSEQDTQPNQNSDRVTLCIEGNISAGKSTLLSWLSEDSKEPIVRGEKGFEIRDLCEVVTEPVDKWQCVGGSKENNLLERFYKDPKRHAYEFQNYVFLTRLDVNRKTFDGEKPLRLLERSVFSDRLVFVRAVHESQWLTDEQLELYDSWFNPMLQEVPGLIPDGFIYLRAEPDTCMRRLLNRARQEELTVTNSYLEGLHLKHEDWFSRPEDWTYKDGELKERKSTLFKASPRVLTLDAELVTPQNVAIPKELEGSVIWLGNNGILSPNTAQGGSSSWVPDEVKAVMSQIPALVLDADKDINVESDVDAKRHYANLVKRYFEFVRSHTKAQRQFWKREKGEELRKRWDIVNNMTEEDLKEIKEKMGEKRSKERTRLVLS